MTSRHQGRWIGGVAGGPHLIICSGHLPKLVESSGRGISGMFLLIFPPLWVHRQKTNPSYMLGSYFGMQIAPYMLLKQLAETGTSQNTEFRKNSNWNRRSNSGHHRLHFSFFIDLFRLHLLQTRSNLGSAQKPEFSSMLFFLFLWYF